VVGRKKVVAPFFSIATKKKGKAIHLQSVLVFLLGGETVSLMKNLFYYSTHAIHQQNLPQS
jgi:hypothetical protein